jgi:hypothetical protein
MMKTPFVNQDLSIVIGWGNRMNFMSLSEELTYKIHAEIIDVPGGIEDNGNFHGLDIYTANSIIRPPFDKQ